MINDTNNYTKAIEQNEMTTVEIEESTEKSNAKPKRTRRLLGWPGDHSNAVNSLFEKLKKNYPEIKISRHPSIGGLKELVHNSLEAQQYIVVSIFEIKNWTWRIRIQANRLGATRTEDLALTVVNTVLEQNSDILKYYWYGHVFQIDAEDSSLVHLEYTFYRFPIENTLGSPVHILNRDQLPALKSFLEVES